jgi:RNA polymerase sigma factor (TIGR02999 family)
MSGGRPTDLTLLLDGVNGGRPGAVDELAEAVHEHLRSMARRHLAKDFGPRMAGVTIQPTVLANDTLMKLIRQRQKYDNGGHLFAIASRLMMRVLLDYHRERKAAKRGGSAIHVPLGVGDDPGLVDPSAGPPGASEAVDVEAINVVLDKLATLDPRKADVVRYRILWGLTNPEIAKATGVGLATVERDWAFAKAWLSKELQSCRN